MFILYLFIIIIVYIFYRRCIWGRKEILGIEEVQHQWEQYFQGNNEYHNNQSTISQHINILKNILTNDKNNTCIPC